MPVEYLIIFFARARVRRGKKKGKNRKKSTAMASSRQNRKILSFPPFKAAASGKSTRAMPVVSSDVVVATLVAAHDLYILLVYVVITKKNIYIHKKSGPTKTTKKLALFSLGELVKANKICIRLLRRLYRKYFYREKDDKFFFNLKKKKREKETEKKSQ